MTTAPRALSALRQLLEEDAERKIDFALRVATMSALGLNRRQIAERTGVELHEITRVIRWLRRVLRPLRNT